MSFPKLISEQKEAQPFEGEQQITPLLQPKEEGPKEPKKLTVPADTVEYVDIQCNKVVAFLINWIKTVFAKDVIAYLNSDYKEQIKEEIIKELKK